MTALNRKLLRDLWNMRGQAVAISLVLACGIAAFVMSLSMRVSLVETLASYYDRYRFAEVFANVKRAPNPVAERIADIPGVAVVSTRVVVGVNLDIRGLREPAVGRIISLPDRGPPLLNDVFLRKGRRPQSGHDGEVLIDEEFALKHKFDIGDTITAVINGRKQGLRIVGMALSPEYVFPIREGEVLPDTKRFGIFWMGYQELASAYNLFGAFNDVALKLEPGANEQEVRRQLDELVREYGGFGSYGRKEHLSNRFLENEIAQLKGTAVIVPAIFLGVAGFLLNVVLTRLIQTQREQIAALKAFGYTAWEVGWHYLKFVFVLVGVGVLLGTLFGLWMGQEVTKMYALFFHFPYFHFMVDSTVLPIAVGVGLLAGTLGAAGAVLAAVRLPPAEAMRPEPPAKYSISLIERLGLRRFLSPTLRMILRNLARQPVKTALAIFGVTLATSLIVLGNFGEDMIGKLLDEQFNRAQRQDMTVSFVEPASPSGLSELKHLPGVLHAEPVRIAPVRLVSGTVARRLAITGVEPDRTLFALLDRDGNDVPVPEEGVLLSEALAQLLNVKPGETVQAEIQEGHRPVRDLVVAGTIKDYTGMAAYMNRQALHRLLREGDCVSLAYLAVDGRYQDELYHRLKRTPRVASVVVKTAAIQSFNETVGENMAKMRFFNLFFAVVIAGGVVYNSARISLSERSRELATLRVLGFTRLEISMILLGELAVLVLTAIPLGLLLGNGFVQFMVVAMATEDQRFPAYVSSWTNSLAASVILAAAVVSGLIVRRALDRLDLVAVLKSRE